jgi:hypothetical protein
MKGEGTFSTPPHANRECQRAGKVNRPREASA